MADPCLQDLIAVRQEPMLELQPSSISQAIEPIFPVNLCSLGHPSECSYDKLSEILERIENDSLYFTRGMNLSPEHKEMIQPGDIWKISLIEEVPSCCRPHIGKAFTALGFDHYVNLQKDVWFRELTKQFTLRMKHEPTNLELSEEFNKYGVGPKYKLCYIMSFPRKITFDCTEYPKNRYCADGFLVCAERLSEKIFGDSFPYWEIINANTTLENLGA